MDTALQTLEGQIREAYGRVVYSHKTQIKAADLALERHNLIKWAQIVLSAVTTGGIIETLAGDSGIGAIVSIIASTILLGLNTYTKDNDLGSVAQKHRVSSNAIWLTREKYLNLLTDIRIGQASLEELLARRDVLLSELHATYEGATNSTFIGKAYSKAQKALQELEDLTFSNDEIDKLLPPELRRS